MADASARPKVDASFLEDHPVFEIKEIRVGKCTDKSVALTFSLARSDNGKGIVPLEADTSAPVVGTMGTQHSEASIAMQVAEKLAKWKERQLLCFQVEQAYNTITASLASWVSSDTWKKLPIIKAKGTHIHKNVFTIVVADLEAETPYSFRVVAHSKGGDSTAVQVSATTLSAAATAEQERKAEEERLRKLHESQKAKLAAPRKADEAAGASKPAASAATAAGDATTELAADAAPASD